MVLIGNKNIHKKCVKYIKNTKNCCGKKKKARKYIPKKIREEVWVKTNGESFNSKCNIIWCSNIITVFDYHIGHNIPHSKGGSIELSNLRPICSRCNLSMSNNYTIEEWNKLIKSKNSHNSYPDSDNADNNNLLMKKIKDLIYLCVTFGLI